MCSNKRNKNKKREVDVKMSKGAKIGLGIGGAVLALIAGVVMWFVGVSNNLVQLEAEVDNSWSQVENSLQRRYDLIPNLVSSVEGSMKQEQAIFTAIADARRTVESASTVEETAEANTELSSNLQTLVNVIHEDYPQLQSNVNVQNLMTQLEGTENRIATERMRYNDTVTKYNVKIKQIPTNIVANIAGYQERDLFEMQEGAEVAPEVEFDFGG